MNRYPTPPSTSSPKHNDHAYHSGHKSERHEPSIAIHKHIAPTKLYFSSHLQPQSQSQDQISTINSTFTNNSTAVPSSTSPWTSATPDKTPLYERDVHKVPDFHGIISQDPSYNLPTRTDAPIISTYKTYPQQPVLKKGHGDGYFENIQSGAPQPQPHRPAQETYWQETSDPVFPSYITPTQNQPQSQSQSQSQTQHPYSEQFNPSHPTHPGPPPRRSSFPIPTSHTHPSTTSPNSPYYNPSPWSPSWAAPPSQTHPPPPQPHRRRSSPIPGHTPPRITSPLKKPYSPHSFSRPRPRPGLVKRMIHRFRSWLSSLVSWVRGNPLKSGLLTFIPLMLGARVVKTVKGVRAFLEHGGSKKKGKGGEEGRGEEFGNSATKVEKRWYEEIFGDFKGFAGSKGGSFDGFLMIVHMLVNHYCKLSPSNIPRAASILLELYFLDLKKL